MLLIFGFLVMICMCAIVGMLTGNAIVFADLPSALIILVPLVFFLCVTTSGKIMGRYCRSSFIKHYAYTRGELAGIACAAKNAIRFILGLGGFGFFAGIIASLTRLDTLEYLGPNLAISLLTVLYAITFSFFTFLPLQAWAENRLSLLAEETDL